MESAVLFSGSALLPLFRPDKAYAQSERGILITRNVWTQSQLPVSSGLRAFARTIPASSKRSAIKILMNGFWRASGHPNPKLARSRAENLRPV